MFRFAIPRISFVRVCALVSIFAASSSAFAVAGPRVGFVIARESTLPSEVNKVRYENAILLKFDETIQIPLDDKFEIKLLVNRSADDVNIYFCLSDLQLTDKTIGCETVSLPIDGRGSISYKDKRGYRYSVQLSVSLQELPTNSKADGVRN